MNEASKAMEQAIRRAHIKAEVVRALAFWETWVVIASLIYLLTHVVPWAWRGFPV